MNKGRILSCLLVSGFVISCHSTTHDSMKDLGQHMMDMKIYQENLGDEIRAGRIEYAMWLVTDLDSILRLIGREFPQHRKLTNSFSYFYKKDLSQPVSGIKSALKSGDTATGMKYYSIMVKRCNGCHIDHDIDKVVRY